MDSETYKDPVLSAAAWMVAVIPFLAHGCVMPVNRSDAYHWLELTLSHPRGVALVTS